MRQADDARRSGGQHGGVVLDGAGGAAPCGQGGVRSRVQHHLGTDAVIGAGGLLLGRLANRLGGGCLRLVVVRLVQRLGVGGVHLALGCLRLCACLGAFVVVVVIVAGHVMLSLCCG